jgi:hypothetical protein
MMTVRSLSSGEARQSETRVPAVCESTAASEQDDLIADTDPEVSCEHLLV